ncbi:MAG: CBS domain-containing protein [Gammaproteobacteria bacterium]|nr:CBS domain-containing protein [Gammaproteobacteria bacterium]MCZ6716518.1 CBS domain-containing protein [Gammaproteobacteria bacterium]MCZ6827060.1 CBS domain-containing protein [Gammaproteobacteria bacterium]MCZ6913063.1 CBS domain-containing protein [Pseudomonadota bacterium]
MNTLSHLLHGKGNEVWSIGPDATVYDAIHLMAEKGIGALVVLKDESPVGVISERDYARDVVLKDRSSKETLVKEIMSDKVVYADPHQTVDECLAVMTEKRIRHLPVMDGDQMIGLVSMGDLVKVIIAEQKLTIDQLERYITG